MTSRDIEEYLILVERIKEAWEKEKRARKACGTILEANPWKALIEILRGPGPLI